MARVCIVFGLLLCGVTMAALFVSTQKNPAQFIPMMMGIPILFCGVVGLNPHRLSTSLRFAMGIALLGAILGGSRIGQCCVRMGQDHHVNLFALKIVSAMTVVCLVFAVLCLFSMLRNRRRRRVGYGVAGGRVVASAHNEIGPGQDDERA